MRIQGGVSALPRPFSNEDGGQRRRKSLTGTWTRVRLRASTEELAERERLDNLDQDKQYRLVRQAAEAHRRVRMYARQSIKPGMTMTEVADLIENGVRTVVEAQGLERGIAFPTGLSLNECAAHYTPNPGDKRGEKPCVYVYEQSARLTISFPFFCLFFFCVVLLDTDVLKVDIGVHVKGRICDSAFTLTFDGGRQWEPLLEAVRAATETGIKEAGIDARLGEIGAAIQETMESHECQVDGRTLPSTSVWRALPSAHLPTLPTVKAIRNLCGHSIEQYRIHGSHSVPIVAELDNVIKMIEGHYYAIETFGSTGLGYTVERGACSHYYKSRNSSSVPASSVTLFSARKLLQTIDESFGTLPFCRRYLERAGEKNYLLGVC